MIVAVVLLVAVGLVRVARTAGVPQRLLIDSAHDILLAAALLCSGLLLVSA